MIIVIVLFSIGCGEMKGELRRGELGASASIRSSSVPIGSRCSAWARMDGRLAAPTKR